MTVATGYRPRSYEQHLRLANAMIRAPARVMVDHADDGCTQIGGAKTKAKSMMHWPAKAGDGTQFSEIGARMTEVKLEQSKPPGPGDFRHGAPSYPAYARRGVGPNSA